MAEAKPEAVRCAIYTRVSTPDQANGDFSSLDNQREMAEAYIRSQASKGWTRLETRYDDAGFSGGTMERPALDRLLHDSEDGFVDCIVVAKIDRLSRSLLDFTRIVDILDRHGVGFVSVTQQFDTSSSMGKLTLNILLSFAQFEREMIGERTREKMVAARRKGKWIGGVPPLGYDCTDGRLAVNPDEATRVRAIFDLYLERESLTSTLAELARRHWHTKTWTTKRGHDRTGRPFQKPSLRRLLTSPVYVGTVVYDGQTYDGEHDGIVDPEVWARVQRILKRNGSNGGRGVRNRHGALLKGIFRCAPCDSAMVHTFSKKNGRSYRYYVCGKAQRTGWATCPTKSVPAEEIEQCIYERIRAIGTDPALVAETIRAARAQLTEKTTQLEAEVRITEQQLRRLEDEKQSLLETIGKGGRVASKAAERLDQVTVELASTTSRLASLTRQLSDVRGQTIDADDLTTVVAQFDPIWDVLLPRERVRIVRLLVQQVDYDGETGTLGITFHPSGIKALVGDVAEKTNDTNKKGGHR
jgi:site-specific DNA recombinase